MQTQCDLWRPLGSEARSDIAAADYRTQSCLGYHEARWAVEIFITRAHSTDIATRLTARRAIRATCRALHAQRYQHGSQDSCAH